MKIKILSILFFAATLQACNSNDGTTTAPHNKEGAYSGMSTHQMVGVVSVSTKGLFGHRTKDGIKRRLRKQAKRQYGSATITNIRYENNTAYADVIK